jgi:hypothetical protein
MNDLALRCAVAAVRAWTRVYTYGLAVEQREARREEIDSDLWESVKDTTGAASDRRTLALQIAARLIAGVPDDFGWRSEQAPAASVWRWRVGLTVVVATVFALWLVGERTTTEKLPDLPEGLLSPPYKVKLIDPPPPPPPPPPCPPAGFPQPPVKCTR